MLFKLTQWGLCLHTENSISLAMSASESSINVRPIARALPAMIPPDSHVILPATFIEVRWYIATYYTNRVRYIACPLSHVSASIIHYSAK